VRRHDALVPLSHDHHHGLVGALRLRRAADGDAAARRDAAAAFLELFEAETRRHFRDEEEQLLPLLVELGPGAGELLTQTLLDHQRLRALVLELRAALAAGDVPAPLARELGQGLHDHIRFEERTLFPFVEERLSAEALERLGASLAGDAAGPVRTGPLWGTETEDLNATLLAWAPGEGPAEHVNEERDVLIAVLAGGATVTIDGEPRLVREGDVVVVEKGRARRIAAGPGGVRYVTVHLRRPPLRIAPAPPA
jgi:quercetin dioxygenase-like cupin family protein